MLGVAVLAILLAPAEILKVEHLAVPAPSGYILEKKSGPDFAVYYVHPKQQSTPVLGLYLGNFASSFAPRDATRPTSFRLGRKTTKWRLWQTSEGGVTEYHAEALLVKPFGTEPEYSTQFHLFLAAPTAADLAALQEMAASIRPISAEK